MKKSFLGLALGLLLISSVRAEESNITFDDLSPAGSTVRAGQYQLDLGEADQTIAPRAWQGPIKILNPNGQTCSVSDNVALIERPLRVTKGYLLYISTYSGSNDRLYIVDARDCSIKWKSPFFTGTSKISGNALLLNEAGRWSIGSDGIPEKK